MTAGRIQDFCLYRHTQPDSIVFQGEQKRQWQEVQQLFPNGTLHS